MYIHIYYVLTLCGGNMIVQNKTQQETCPIAMPDAMFRKGMLTGCRVVRQVRSLGEVAAIFESSDSLEPDTAELTVYTVESYMPHSQGIEGGLYFGFTTLQPGNVRGEYFMTKGHYHSTSDRAEYYWGIEGEGVLILMDRQGAVRGEKMFPGSLHYIPGDVAHRVANTGISPLVFGACWPSDAGHDYDTIEKHGFGARLKTVNGEPTFVKG